MDKSSMFAKLYQQLDELDGARITVGVQKEKGTNFHGEEVSASDEVLTIANVHEFGADIKVTPRMRAFLHHHGIHLKAETTVIHIPERSFIRRGHAEGKESFRKDLNKFIGDMFDGKLSVDEMLDMLGQQAIVDTMSNLGSGTKPISSATKKLRKEEGNADTDPTPLIDTGRNIQNHITYRVEKRNSKGE